MKFNKLFLVFLLLGASIAASFASSPTMVGIGDVITLTFATTSPLAGAPVVKGTSKATGAIVGVALNGLATVNESVSVATRGVFDLSVTASSTVGSIAIGDYIYTTMGGIGVCTADLSNISTGVLFGQALEAITATTTAAVYSTIKVLVHQPGHL